MSISVPKFRLAEEIAPVSKNYELRQDAEPAVLSERERRKKAAAMMRQILPAPEQKLPWFRLAGRLESVHVITCSITGLFAVEASIARGSKLSSMSAEPSVGMSDFVWYEERQIGAKSKFAAPAHTWDDDISLNWGHSPAEVEAEGRSVHKVQLTQLLVNLEMISVAEEARTQS